MHRSKIFLEFLKLTLSKILGELFNFAADARFISSFDSGNSGTSLEELKCRHALNLLLSRDVLKFINVDLGEDDFSVEGLGLLLEPGGDHSAWRAPCREIVDNDERILKFSDKVSSSISAYLAHEPFEFIFRCNFSNRHIFGVLTRLFLFSA